MENLQTFLLSVGVALGAANLLLSPKRSKGAGKSVGRSIILDSCALIDGRIVELAEAGFTPEILVVPSFVIRELQLLADGSDSQKRERARFGLDIANKLKELSRVTVVIERKDCGVMPTDDKLLLLAKALKAPLYTTDFNLSKVAAVEGVKVLNVNELAQKLKPTFLPGERFVVSVMQKGSGRGQGVGYTDDGTMVVVEQAERMIGKQVPVEVDRMINTVAGKMIFAKRTDDKKQPKSLSHERRQKPVNQREDEQFVTDLASELR
jgi:uncharacterized protein YacL